MKTKCLLSLTISMAMIAGMLTAFVPASQVQPQSGDLNIRITQIDNSKFPQVTVYVSVVNAKGEPVAVNPGDLVIREGDKIVPASNLQSAGQVGPMTTLLVMDVSGSMEKLGKIESAKSVAKEYVAQMREGDTAGIVVFNTMVRTLQVIKGDRAELSKAIDTISPGGDTAMYDALISAVNQLNGVAGRKAILVYTDGLDNRSQSSVDGVINSIGRSGLTISTVGFGDVSQGTGSQEALDEPVLKKLAGDTGGLYGYAENRDQLSALYASFGASMRSEYVLTYKSPYGLRNGVNRSLSVTLDPRSGSTVTQGASATYNPGGLIPEVPVGGSWPLFFGLLVFIGALVAGPQLYPLVRERIHKPRANIKMKEPKKVAIKLKD
jgi:Ca-activated chloride channel homolog